MDGRTMIVLLTAVLAVVATVFLATRASVERTRVGADASVARAQEHTRRSEGRHDLVDLLGWIRGERPQTQRENHK